ncbi:MAG: uncharacterized SAM-binding protein YcdF (DUF218 family) [Myxococcota bacterium]|jgi:uncharacterized SAM-binding protein YcdF (DUF218 family)
MVDVVLILGKELRRDPVSARQELRARSAAAAVAFRDGARAVLALEAPLTGLEDSGSALVVGHLRHLGVPAGAIVAEQATRSTREEALRAHALVRERGLGRLLVITAGYHVPRARAVFTEHFGAGAVTVHAPEGFLRGATVEERRWIHEGVPGTETEAREVRLERWLSRAEAALRWLPERVRWQAEVRAGALLRRSNRS